MVHEIKGSELSEIEDFEIRDIIKSVEVREIEIADSQRDRGRRGTHRRSTRYHGSELYSDRREIKNFLSLFHLYFSCSRKRRTARREGVGQSTRVGSGGER